MNDERYTYTYDAYGDMLTDSYVYWSFDQFLVYHPWRETFTYDGNGHRLTELYKVVGSPGPFVNNNRWTYAYDSTWNIVSELNAHWVSGQWVYSQRYTYTYDAEGNMLLWLVDHWSDSQWVNWARTTYIYDSIGDLISLLGENWTNNLWMNSELLVNFMKRRSREMNRSIVGAKFGGKSIRDVWHHKPVSLSKPIDSHTHTVGDFLASCAEDPYGLCLVNEFEEALNINESEVA